MPLRHRSADLVVRNATVRTLDSGAGVAGAMAVKDGRIVGIGSMAELRELVDHRTEVLDAGGRCVMPGFIDPHVHFNTAAVESVVALDLLAHEPRTIADVLEAVADRASSLPDGTWVRLDNLNPDQLTSFELPTRQQLDRAAPRHPAVVFTIGFHVACANSAALAAAGIGPETSDPPGGQIDRDADGEPTGILRERGKLRLDPRRDDTVLPRLDLPARVAALGTHVDYLLERGVTGIHDVVVDPDEIRAYQELRRAGQMRVRVQLLIRGVESQISTEQILAVGLQGRFGDPWLSIGGVKLSVDGLCVTQNAAVYEAYPDDADNHGIIRIEQPELNDQVLRCHRDGMRVAIHAIGPRAVDMALDALDQALTVDPRPDHRHRIEHAYLPGSTAQMERMARLGVIASTQPAFLHGVGDGWRRIWGEDAMRGVLPLRSWLDAGIRVMASTDHPCVPADPFLGLSAAVSRRTKGGVVLDASQAITIDEALRLQTTAAAFGGFEEHRTGSLELGKLADFVVLSGDPIATPPEQLDQIRVDLTAVDGVVRYLRPGAADF